MVTGHHTKCRAGHIWGVSERGFADLAGLGSADVNGMRNIVVWNVAIETAYGQHRLAFKWCQEERTFVTHVLDPEMLSRCLEEGLPGEKPKTSARLGDAGSIRWKDLHLTPWTYKFTAEVAEPSKTAMFAQAYLAVKSAKAHYNLSDDVATAVLASPTLSDEDSKAKVRTTWRAALEPAFERDTAGARAMSCDQCFSCRVKCCPHAADTTAGRPCCIRCEARRTP